MKKEIWAIDMHNGELLVKFGDVFVHGYDFDDPDHILTDINSYFRGSDPSRWDNNEMEASHYFEEVDCCEILDLEEIYDLLRSRFEDEEDE